MGDIHIHARDDTSGRETHKETFVTAGQAALNGGVVHVADMPNNPDAPVDDDSYAAKCQHLAARDCDVHVTLYAGIGPGTRPLSSDAPYKAYMGPRAGDLFFESLANSTRPWFTIEAARSASTARTPNCSMPTPEPGPTS